MDAIGSTTLFRPTQATRSTRDNLNGFYNRTSEFVQEKFENIRGELTETTGRKLNPTSEQGLDDRPVALRPHGLGEIIDMFV